jgi:hypothetical protein
MTQVFVVTVGAADGTVAHNAPVGVFSTQDKADAYVGHEKTTSPTYDWRATGYDVDALPVGSQPKPVEEPKLVEESKAQEPEDVPEEEDEPEHGRARHAPPPPPPHRGGRR